MAVAAETQHGTAYIFGVYATTITCAAPSVVIAGNISDIKITTEFSEIKMPSQNGSVVEGLIGYQQMRRLEFNLAPSGTNRANAVAEADQWLSLTPNVIITLADVLGATSTSFEGTYNLKSGGSLSLSKEGVGIIGIQLESYATAADGAVFAGLVAAS